MAFPSTAVLTRSLLLLVIVLSCLFHITSTALSIRLATDKTLNVSITNSAAAVSVLDLISITALTSAVGLHLYGAPRSLITPFHIFGCIVWFTASVFSLVVFAFTVATTPATDYGAAVAGLIIVSVGFIPQAFSLLFIKPRATSTTSQDVLTSTVILEEQQPDPIIASKKPAPHVSTTALTRLSTLSDPAALFEQVYPVSTMDWSDSPSAPSSSRHSFRAAIRSLSQFPTRSSFRARSDLRCYSGHVGGGAVVTAAAAAAAAVRNDEFENWDTSAVETRYAFSPFAPVRPWAASTCPAVSSTSGNGGGGSVPSSPLRVRFMAVDEECIEVNGEGRNGEKHSSVPRTSTTLGPRDQSHVHPLFRTTSESTASLGGKLEPCETRR